MTLEERKQNIIKHMNYCMEARQFLLENNKSKEAQMKIKNGAIKYGGFIMDLESPVAGGTEADWIRLNYDDVYLYLYDECYPYDNGERYEYDPYGEAGAEIIIAESYDDFINQLNNITEDLEEHYNW